MSLKARLVALGERIFRNRSWTPIPFLLVLVFCTFKEASRDVVTWVPGLLLLGLGEGLRLWSVAVIGKTSRTRGSGVERLVASGPYAYVRNPLYLGNFFLTMGAVFISELLWVLPIVFVLFVAQYVPIVLWEESVLLKRFGADYAAYCRQVPRWLPRWRPWGPRTPRSAYHWPASWWSERSTFGALACLLVLMLLKENIRHLPKYFQKHPFHFAGAHWIS